MLASPHRSTSGRLLPKEPDKYPTSTPTARPLVACYQRDARSTPTSTPTSSQFEYRNEVVSKKIM